MPHLSDVAGHLAESITGCFFGTLPGIQVALFPERGIEPKADSVITFGQRRIPVAVKYRQRIDELRDTSGLRAFIEKTVYDAPFGGLVTLSDEVIVANPRIVALPLATLSLMR